MEKASLQLLNEFDFANITNPQIIEGIKKRIHENCRGFLLNLIS